MVSSTCCTSMRTLDWIPQPCKMSRVASLWPSADLGFAGSQSSSWFNERFEFRRTKVDFDKDMWCPVYYTKHVHLHTHVHIPYTKPYTYTHTYTHAYMYMYISGHWTRWNVIQSCWNRKLNMVHETIPLAIFPLIFWNYFIQTLNSVAEAEEIWWRFASVL